MPAPVSTITFGASRNHDAIVSEVFRHSGDSTAATVRQGIEPLSRRQAVAASSAMIVAWRSWAQRTASWPIDGWKPERCNARSTVSNGSPSISSVNATRSGAAAGDVEAVVRGLARHPLAMARLHRDGEAADMATVDRRERAPDRDHFGLVRVRELELLEPVAGCGRAATARRRAARAPTRRPCRRPGA